MAFKPPPPPVAKTAVSSMVVDLLLVIHCLLLLLLFVGILCLIPAFYAVLSVLSSFEKEMTGSIIRIYHECEGRIEKSVPRIGVWHHEDDKR